MKKIYEELSEHLQILGKDAGKYSDALEELRLHSVIISNLNEGINLISMDTGIILYTNPRFEEMFDYKPGELLGKHVSIINASTDKSPEMTADEIISVLKSVGNWNGEIKNIKKDGTEFWCYASVSIFHHKKYGDVYVSIHTDITQRKKAEEALRRMQQHLQSVINTASVVLWAVNREGVITLSEGAGLASLGFEAGQLVGKSVFDIYAECPAVLKLVRRGLRGETFMADVEVDGRVWHTRYVPGRNSVTDAFEMTGISLDITQRKRDEVEKEKLIKKLEEALAKIKTLKGLLPICACCKRIRDNKGSWHRIENYIKEHTDADFSHGYCPDCYNKISKEME